LIFNLIRDCQINDPADPSDRTDAETVDWARFKREIYHKFHSAIFASLQRPARSGEAIKCGDSQTRVLFPGIPYDSLDGEEACMFSACRAAHANFPCPRCLVHKDDLNKITKVFPARTVDHMRQVYTNAMNAPNKTERERILQNYGLHQTEVFVSTS
jgi:hypothetical protein